MPSSPNYKRNYKQEKKTNDRRMGGAKKANSYRSKLNQARKKLGLGKGDPRQAGHKVAAKNGGSGSMSNIRKEDGHMNQAKGGKSGSRAGKARGARKGHRSR